MMEEERRRRAAAWVCPKCGTENHGEFCSVCRARRRTEPACRASGAKSKRRKKRSRSNIIPVLAAVLVVLVLFLGWALTHRGDPPKEEPIETTAAATQATEKTPPTVAATYAAETTEPTVTETTSAATETPTEASTEAPTEVPTTEPTEAYVPAAIPPESEQYSSADYLKVKPGDNLFAIMPSYFEFCSGAGGWSTRLNLYEDGSFDGYFSDWDMGVIGEGYIKRGTCRMCTFSGEFSTPRKVTDYIYSVSAKRLNYPKDVDTEWIEDGARYIQATPYGLDKTSEYYIYLPGCPSSVFTEDQLTYISYNTIVGRYDQIRQGNFAIYAQDGSSWLGFWGRKGDNVFSHDYEYQHGAFKSELQPDSYVTDGGGLIFMTENGDRKIILGFDWTKESQRTFVAEDKNGTGEYDVNLYVKKDLQSVVVDVKSRQGTSLKAWGGTEDGQLTAVYSIITYNHASEETESVRLDKSQVKVGGYVRFGSFEQDNDPGDGKEPIEWRVLTLDKSGKKALLVSRYALAARYYHSGSAYPTWANSNIRGWLNFNFWWDAFTEQEQSLIVRTKLSNPAYEGIEGGPDTWDRVFLLSRGEAATYFTGSDDRLVKPTLYALAMGAGTADENGCCWWWLRTPGAYSYDAGTVYAIGGIDHTGANVKNATIAVRPAIWVELSE